jgi:DNA-3-methyladenine glycosylase II
MRLVLKPRPPYDFNLHPKFFCFSKPCPEVYEGGVWKRALRLKSKKLAALRVRMLGDVEKPRLEVNVFNIDEKEKQEIRDKLSWIFSIEEDLAELYAFMDRDPVLKKVKQGLYGLRPFNYPTVFEGVIKSIIQQQISLVGSMYITHRLIERFGDKVRIGEEEFYEFPSPSSLCDAGIEELRRCGLSKQKAEYIREFSRKVANNEFDPENLKELSSREIIEILTRFKGIGRWTAELVVVTSTGKEALPADDLGARRAVSKFYFDRLISGDELREFTKRWGKFRGIITYYLICASRITSAR